MNLSFDILLYSQTLICLFVGVLFSQSGWDKIIDFEGNHAYIKSVFANTFFNSISPLLFMILTVLEIVAGATCLIGSCLLLFYHQQQLALIGLLLSALSILFLFIGQRVAKEYAGACSLAGYFIITLLGLLLFS
jgi:putative oxidoreductase